MKNYLLAIAILLGFNQMQAMLSGSGPQGSKTTKEHRRSRSWGGEPTPFIFQQPQTGFVDEHKKPRKNFSKNNPSCSERVQSCCVYTILILPLLVQLGLF